MEVLCSPFGETRVGETLGPGGPSPTHTYPHLWVSDTWSDFHENHQLLLYVPTNIQYFTFGFFQIIMEIINFCNTYTVKRSFSILQEIVAIEHATKNHVIFEKQIC